MPNTAVGDTLEERSRLVESILYVTPGILYIYDLGERRNVFVSQGLQRILGYTETEVKECGDNLLATLMHPDDLASYAENTLPRYANCADDDRIVSNYRMRSKDGRWRWLESTEVVYKRDEEGVLQQIMGLAVDITDRKQAEQSLRDSEYFFKESQRASQTGSYRLDVKTGVWDYSEVLGQIFAIDKTFQTDIERWLMLVHPDDREMMGRHYMEDVLGKGSPFNREYRIVRPGSGEVRWVHGMGELVHDASGNPVHMIGTVRDITERHEAMEALNLSEKRLRLAVKAGNIGIWDWDIEHDDLVWDESMYAIYGIRGEDFAGVYDAWAKGLHPEDRAVVEAETSAAVRGDREYGLEFRIIRPDGEVRYLKAASQSIRDPTGKALRMIGVNIDITDRKLAEIELRRHREHLEELVEERTSQLELANHELDSFCHSVSHDLRAPLRHLDGFVGLLLSSCGEELSEDAHRYTEVIASSARRMGELVDDLLAFSRTARQELSRAYVDMDQVLREALVPVREASGRRNIDWRIGKLAPVGGDHNLLRLVWSNLLENAVKYTGRNEAARIEIGCGDVGREIVFTVRDNGVGFDPRYAGKLFGVFQRLHSSEDFEGTGIGLATVQRIVTRHGGRVWAESTPGEGAAFHFALPKPAEVDDARN